MKLATTKPPNSDLAQHPNFDHVNAAQHLSQLYASAQNGLRRVVALGLFCFELKDKHLKHGQFGPWLQAHAPEFARAHSTSGSPQPSTALTTYMQLTQSALDAAGVKLEAVLRISNPLRSGISYCGEFLLVDEDQVPEAAKPWRDAICEVIDGKTQKQLLLEFKSEKQSPQYHPRHPLNPAEELAAQKSQASAIKNQYLAASNLIPSIWPTLSAAERCEVEDERLSLGHFIKANTTKKK